MKTQPIFFAFVLLLSLSGCKKINEELFPLAGSWKELAERTTRIRYKANGKTYEGAYTKSDYTPPSTLLTFGKDGTYSQGSAAGTYALETVNGEGRVVLTTSNGAKGIFAYTLKENKLSMIALDLYKNSSADELLTIGRAFGAYFPPALFPGLTTATSVQEIVIISNYTRQ